MKVSFAVPIKPQPQGSIQSFLLPNREAIMDAAKTIFISPHMSILAIADLITATVKKSRAILTSDNSELKKYRKEVSARATHAMECGGKVMAGKHVPVAVEAVFIFERPASVTSSRPYPVVKPDIDKLLRAAFDSMTGIVYLDDSQVVDLQRVRKVYGPRQCISITAWTIEDIPSAPSLFPDLELPPAEEPF